MQKNTKPGFRSLSKAILVVSPFLAGSVMNAQATTTTPPDSTKAAASAQAPAVQPAQDSPDSTQALVGLLAVANKDQVDAAKVALQKASRADVKTFAQELVDEHSKVLEQLAVGAKSKAMSRDDTTNEAQRSGMRGIAGQYSVNSLKADSLARVGTGPAATVHAANVVAMQKLNSATAETFDQTFLATQIEGHEMLLKLLDKQTTADAKLSGVVAELKSSVQQNLEEARKLQAVP